ncbi:hypothetical protein K461DRAFT_154573 [Myriangium duriaei CBS 260.36]|uniref:Uncharacterized protein n=1 Tax=Myriangium duriaei CBS 260.36 TaxID=1168546 RepID=A0A9P4IXC1_9PEZI|nr:hypothetical protein K461DRAFT_154573 [Myriangium duriaei CBS 260.36]
MPVVALMVYSISRLEPGRGHIHTQTSNYNLNQPRTSPSPVSPTSVALYIHRSQQYTAASSRNEDSSSPETANLLQSIRNILKFAHSLVDVLPHPDISNTRDDLAWISVWVGPKSGIVGAPHTRSAFASLSGMPRMHPVRLSLIATLVKLNPLCSVDITEIGNSTVTEYSHLSTGR